MARRAIVTAVRTALSEELGTQRTDWHWQYAGTIPLKQGKSTLALQDLTGFDGRCDAVLLTTDAQSALAKLAGNGCPSGKSAPTACGTDATTGSNRVSGATINNPPPANATL